MFRLLSPVRREKIQHCCDSQIKRTLCSVADTRLHNHWRQTNDQSRNSTGHHAREAHGRQVGEPPADEIATQSYKPRELSVVSKELNKREDEKPVRGRPAAISVNHPSG